MSLNTDNNHLIDDFKNFLQQSTLEPFNANEQPDLNTLLREFTELKTEVKTESRQFKNTLDTLTDALTTVEEDNKRLAAELAASNAKLEQQEFDITHTILLEMLEIHEHVNASLTLLNRYRPVVKFFTNSAKRDIRFIDRLKQGQLMTSSRFEKMLQDHQVVAIACVDKMLDPNTMTAVDTGVNPKLENGIVLEELRTGYFYKGQVLRLAEVKVNKTNS